MVAGSFARQTPVGAAAAGQAPGRAPDVPHQCWTQMVLTGCVTRCEGGLSLEIIGSLWSFFLLAQPAELSISYQGI